MEIASYTDHLLTECEAKSNYAKCNRCTEAITKSEHEQHVAEKACNGKPGDSLLHSSSDFVKECCGYCYVSLPPTTEGRVM